MNGRGKTNIAVIIAACLFMLDVVLGLTYSGLSVVIHNRKLDQKQLEEERSRIDAERESMENEIARLASERDMSDADPVVIMETDVPESDDVQTPDESTTPENSSGSDPQPVDSRPEGNAGRHPETSSAHETEVKQTEPPTTEPPTEAPTAAPAIEQQYSAGNLDGYLAIVDGQWWIQYWGKSDSDGSMLSYNAGVAHYNGNGTYTVSVTADTNGFRRDVTGDPFKQYTPEGLCYLAVVINDPDTAWLTRTMHVESVKVNGREIGLRGTPELEFDGDGVILVLYSEYDENMQFVDRNDFQSWTAVEVTYTVAEW